MKKFVLFAAFAALVLSSCTKENGTGFESNVRTVQFTASSVETKTVFGTPDGATYPTLWSDNDAKVGLTMNLAKILEADVTVSADHKTATFAYEFEEAQTNQFVVVNPYVALKSVNSSAGTFMIEVPSGQTSSATSPDERAQVMYGISDVTSKLPSKVNLTLKHGVEYLHISFKNVNLGGGTVQSVGISSEKNIAGRFFVHTDGTYEEAAMLKSISVIPENLDDVWCAIAPADLSNSLLTLSIVTDKGSLSKTLDIPSSFEFKPGKICKLSVNMDGVIMQEPVEYQLVTSEDALHWGDKIIIVAAEYDFALSTAQNSNNRSGTGIAKGDGVILDPSDAVEVLQLGDGIVPGTWSLCAIGGVNDGYLYAAAGYDNKGNYMRTQNKVDELASWQISFGDFTDKDKEAPDAERAIIKAIVPNRPLMRYNVESNLFSSYAETTSMYPIKIYRLKGSPDTSDRFNATMAADGKTISSAAASFPVYVFGNVSWTVSVTGGASVNKASGSGADEITLDIPENTTTSSRTITVSVSTSASVSPKSYSFTITQNGKSSSTISVGTMLFNETWAGGKANASPVAYQQSGEATTTVFGDVDVTYTCSSGALLKSDGLVYIKSGYNGSNPIPDGFNMMNLLIDKNGGYWSIAGIPCAGVSKASLVFRSNYKNAVTIQSDTEGVTIGALNNTSYESDWEKTVYVKQYDITFESTFSGETFNLNFLNETGSNNRIADVELIVTEAK